MWETRAVEFVVDLPVELAENVEEVRERDPEFISKAIRYAFARRLVFDELKNSLPLRAAAVPLRSDPVEPPQAG